MDDTSKIRRGDQNFVGGTEKQLPEVVRDKKYQNDATLGFQLRLPVQQSLPSKLKFNIVFILLSSIDSITSNILRRNPNAVVASSLTQVKNWRNWNPERAFMINPLGP